MRAALTYGRPACSPFESVCVHTVRLVNEQSEHSQGTFARSVRSEHSATIACRDQVGIRSVFLVFNFAEDCLWLGERLPRDSSAELI